MVSQETEHENYPKSYHRRSRLDISLDVLRTVKRGVMKPTRIMYAVNISWRPLQNILEAMVSGGFISKSKAKGNRQSKHYYKITQSGLNVLSYVDKDTDFLRLLESTHSA